MSGILDALTPTTIANYARGAFDDVCENFPTFSLLKKAASIKYDVGGDSLVGPIEAGRYKPIVSAPGMDLTANFVSKVRHTRYVFPWAEIANATYIDRGLLRRNAGDQALVRLKDTEIPALMRDLIVAQGSTTTGDGSLSWQILNQNYSTYAGSGLPVYGFPSFLLAVGATGLNGYNPDTQVVSGSGPAATDREVVPTATSQTYGGLSMARSGLTGVDNLEADAWTPTLVNLKSSVWTGTGNDGANAIGKCLNWAIARGCRFDNTDKTKRPDLAIQSLDHFRFLGDYLASKQTIYMQPQNDSAMNQPNLGYKTAGMLCHANLWFNWDANCPTDTTFIINADQVELDVQPLYADQDNSSPLGSVRGENAGIIETAINFDPTRRGYLVSATSPLQMKCNPRYFVRVSSYA